MDERLRIGKIPYSNLFPIFHVLEKEYSREEYELVEGYPSLLNRLLREGVIDVSPSSSVEYLRNREKYIYLDGHSISSDGPVGSIILLSRVPLESLGGHEVFVTHQSETSVALLRVIFRKFYSLRCAISVTDAPVHEAVAAHSAYLAIGDEALLAARKAQDVDVDTGEHFCRMGTIDHQLFYIYDLGALWREKTGLPFVFALWIGRKDSAAKKREVFGRFRSDLDRSRDRALDMLPDISREPGLPLPPEEILAYWRGIVYGLDHECEKGLELFRKYLEELGLL